MSLCPSMSLVSLHPVVFAKALPSCMSAQPKLLNLSYAACTLLSMWFCRHHAQGVVSLS